MTADVATVSAAELVDRAVHHDKAAWDQLVDLYGGLIRAVTWQFRLSEADAADVAQTTWLRLLEHIHQIKDGSRVGAWLATTARRESLRMVAQRKRLVLSGDAYDFEYVNNDEPEVDAPLLEAERAACVQEAVAQLPPRWRDIMALLSADPPVPYEQISQTLRVPVGSIGPTRQRCLRRLQVLLEM